MTNNATNTALARVTTAQPTYTQLKTYHDESYDLVWCYMHAAPRPCFSPALLNDMNRWCDELRNHNAKSNSCRIRYHVLASDIPGVFNLGGDLKLFLKLIQQRDKSALERYAASCIDMLYANIRHFYQDIITISLVQGDALGGGLEAALSSDVLIAERSAKMGFPEILFNLFPGMGAYSLLSRKIGSAQAERMIMSGKVYSAEELYDLGVVDVLAEDEQGEMAVYNHVWKEKKSANGFRALRAVKESVNPITYEELKRISEIWADAALRLERRNLRMMELLIRGQARREEQGSMANAMD